MSENLLSDRFEASRKHLRGIALRMLGNVHEAEDAVQETWLRLARSDTSDVENLPGWLTTVVSRICLDMLRARTARAEETIDPDFDVVSDDDPEQDILRVDAVGVAMLVLLDRLTPSERLAFVLHDLFDVPFEDIAPILDKTPDAARQLASRARRRVRGGEADAASADRRGIIETFLVAARGGDMTALLQVLDPDVVFRADAAAMKLGSLAARPPWRMRSRDGRKRPWWRSSTASWAWRWCRADRCCSCCTSTCGAGESPGSARWPSAGCWTVSTW